MREASKINRRTVLTGTAALAATPLIPAIAAQAADGWHVNHNPNIFAEGLIGCAGLANGLLSKHKPAGSTIKGFQFMCVGGEIKLDSIWATVITDDYRLMHVRPAVYNGWRDGANYRSQ